MLDGEIIEGFLEEEKETEVSGRQSQSFHLSRAGMDPMIPNLIQGPPDYLGPQPNSQILAGADSRRRRRRRKQGPWGQARPDRRE